MPVHVIMPQLGESVAEGTVVRWMKRPGDRVERDEPLLEISTDKVDAEIPSPAAGVLAKILVKENETVEVNTVIAEIEGDAGQTSEPTDGAQEHAAVNRSDAEETAQLPPPTHAPAPARDVRSSPVVRKLAHEHGIDLVQITGTGLGGRISKQDVLAYLAKGKPTEAGVAKKPASPASEAPPSPARGAQAPAAPSSAPTPAGGFGAGTKVVPMTPMRRQIAEHMVASKHTSAHVASVFEVEMTSISRALAGQGAEFERRNGIKLTYTPFVVRAVVEALKQFPIVNSSVDGANLVYKHDVNIGIAVALDTGLIVPVIKRADEKSFLGIARAVHDLATRARSKRLSIDDVQDGTFTLSNHGVFGSLIGTPVISQPQVAILGVGKIEKRPVVRDDAIAIRSMVYLTLSFDHRVLDGAIADQFMSHIKSSLETWDEPVL